MSTGNWFDPDPERMDALRANNEALQSDMQAAAAYTCSRDADGWQLYSMKGARSVAAGLSELLTAKVRAAKVRLAGEPCLSGRKLALQIQKEMLEAMSKVDDYGARDTEPCWALVDELRCAFGIEDLGRW